MALPKKERIKGRKEFEKIFKTGREIRTPLGIVKFQGNAFRYNRSAVVVPVAVSPQAVDRNRLKRLIFESLQNIFKEAENRRTAVEKKFFTDVLVIAQPGIKDKKLVEITAILRNIFQKANIV